MTLDEAIDYYDRKAEELKSPFGYKVETVLRVQVAEEHKQLAEWLKQLKELKEAYESDYQIDDLIQVCVRLWG